MTFIQVLAVISCVVCVGLADPIQYLPRPRLDGRIVGGSRIDIRAVPWQVSLQRGGSHFCGGSIIGRRHILTAAHCTDGQRAQYIKVRMGSSYHSSNGTVVAVNKIIQHPNFNMQRIDYDYSILELNETIEYDETKRKISLPNQGEEIDDDTECFVTGWGNTQSSVESREFLRGAEVPIVNQNDCADAYKQFGGVTDRMVCAGLKQGGKDACQGDSGGPLVCRGMLVGVVSWGYGCAQPSYPGIYSRVPCIRTWIAEKIGI